MIGETKKLLLIPHLKVHNANALSSPFTIGFPAMTAWLGAVHALQRKLNQQDINVIFSGVGVISHDMDLQTYKGENDFVYSIVGTGNPLDKTGARSAFIEEARCHLDVSLVIQFDNIAIDERSIMLEAINHLLHAKMKMAGGDIKSFEAPYCWSIQQGDAQELKKIQRSLMPGYAVIERRELMVAAMEKGLDALDGLIDYLAIHHQCDVDEDGKVTWQSKRKTYNDNTIGWVVPIATGFHGISELGQAKNQRDADTPHRFAESVVTLGEFKMIHRIHSIEHMLWYYQQDNDMYLCQQRSFMSRSVLNDLSATDSIDDEF